MLKFFIHLPFGFFIFFWMISLSHYNLSFKKVKNLFCSLLYFKGLVETGMGHSVDICCMSK